MTLISVIIIIIVVVVVVVIVIQYFYCAHYNKAFGALHSTLVKNTVNAH